MKRGSPRAMVESRRLVRRWVCALLLLASQARSEDGSGFARKFVVEGMLQELPTPGSDRMLKVDANGGWTVQTARHAIARMDDYDIHYYEEPVETYEEMALLRPFTRASFSTHIMDLPRAVELKCPDTMVTNLVEMGGIARTIAFIRACEQFNIGFRFHSGETSVASAAYLQVSAAMEHIREPSQTLFRWYGDDVCNEGTPVPKNGVVPVPTGPGLGVTLDPKALKRCHERYLEEGQFPMTKTGNSGLRTRFSRV